MAAVLAAVMALVAAYCLARRAVPAWRDADHPGELDALHVVMGACMVAMLLEAFPSEWHVGIVAVFTGAGLWCFSRSLSRRARQLYARFGIVCTAMLAMLIPHSAIAHEANPKVMAVDHHSMGVQLGMPGIAELSTWAVIAALIAMMSVALCAVMQLGTGRQSVACRLSAACEVAMATSMGYLLAMGLAS